MGEAKRRKHDGLGQLMVSSRLVRTTLSARLAELALYPGQDAVLLAIGEDLVPLRDLADRLQVRPPTVTKTVARLSKEGLLEKRAVPNEPRQNGVALTERGVALLAEVRDARRETEREAFADLSKKQRRTLRKLLRRVERSLEAKAVEEPETRD